MEGMMSFDPDPDEDWGDLVLVTGFFYRVDFGPGVKKRYHFVQNGVCGCHASENCKAVTLAETYLKRGGKPAPNPPDGFYAVLPHHCPVCGAAVQPDLHLNSPVRGTGWECLANKSHYWQSLGRQKTPACHCFAYPFAHEPGSGNCKSGKEETQATPCEITMDSSVLVPA